MSAEQELAQANVKIAALIEEVTRYRDSAMGLNNIYASITEGRQAVADGKYFSVPGNGAYMRLYRRQGSSAQLIAEFPDRDELNSVIAQLGPLLGRGVVGGSGNLMAEGYNGWGGAISYGANSDFHTLPYGAVGNEGQSSIPANAPLSGNNRYAGLKLGNTNAELLLLASTLTPGRPIFAAVKSAAGWEGYRRMLSDRDILGAVSQSNGVPTGAIIERGSNANGVYVKFADGSLFMASLKDINVEDPRVQFFTAPVVYIQGPAPSVTVSHVSTSSPNPALYLRNVRALFLDPSNGFAFRVETPGTSSGPGTNSEQLIFSAWVRWY